MCTIEKTFEWVIENGKVKEIDCSFTGLKYLNSHQIEQSIYFTHKSN